MTTKKFIREYPDTWAPRQVHAFVKECYRVGGIPQNALVKVKHVKRRGVKRLTFTWKV